jgi:hypothetical protein
VGAVDVIILHPLPGPGTGPLERGLAEARRTLAERNGAAFAAAGAATVRVVAGVPDGRPFGARLHEIRADLPPGRGLVVLGSGALPLAEAADFQAFVAAAGAAEPTALANNRYSADIVAVSGPATAILARLPEDFPGDNALPRWLDEVGGLPVRDLRTRWRLAVDLDSPLDVILATRRRRAAGTEATEVAGHAAVERIQARRAGVRRVLDDPRAELIVAGRTSAATIGWLERHARCRVRALVEERGLRASSPLAVSGLTPGPRRPSRSILGLVLERDGPAALGVRLAELADAALVDSRVLLAHRFGSDEAGWPGAEDRFASDLLDPDAVDDPWLAALTASAAAASIPVLLGGHSLVGPGVRLVGRRG